MGAVRRAVHEPRAVRREAHEPNSKAQPTIWAGQVPLLKPGRYADGLPLHEVQYLCCKLILKPIRFRSRQDLFDFAKVLRAPAEQHDVKLSVASPDDEPIQIREVLFVDTSD